MNKPDQATAAELNIKETSRTGSCHRLIATIRNISQDRDSGEIIIKQGRDNARIHIAKGKIAWVRASTSQQTLFSELVNVAGLDAADLQNVFDECKREGLNFGETAVEWGLIDRDSFLKILRQHTVRSLELILAWGNPELLFVNSERTFNDALAFEPDEIIALLDPQLLTQQPPANSPMPLPENGKLRNRLDLFKDIDQFTGLAIFLPHGELVAETSVGPVNFAEAYALILDVFLAAQKTTSALGLEPCTSLQVTARDAEIILRNVSAASGGQAADDLRIITISEKQSPVGLIKIQIEKLAEELPALFSETITS